MLQSAQPGLAEKIGLDFGEQFELRISRLAAELPIFLADDSTYNGSPIQQLYPTSAWRQARNLMNGELKNNPSSLYGIARDLTDPPGKPFSYFANPDDVLGAFGAPVASEVTPEGYVFTGFGEPRKTAERGRHAFHDVRVTALHPLVPAAILRLARGQTILLVHVSRAFGRVEDELPTRVLEIIAHSIQLLSRAGNHGLRTQRTEAQGQQQRGSQSSPALHRGCRMSAHVCSLRL